MRSLFENLKALLAAVMVCVSCVGYAHASDSLQITMDQQVVYCSARMQLSTEALKLAMKDGVDVSTLWHIDVGRVRDYWLNENIADLTAIRRAKPDLLTRSWLLTDVSGGISNRVYQIEEALSFLSGLDNFPVLDRSLLSPDAHYLISVSAEVHSGGINEAWWARLWQSSAASMQKDFSLP